MAEDRETGSLLDKKLNDSSSSPPQYSMIQSLSSPASNRNGLSQCCTPSSPATSATEVRAPLLDDRVVSAVIRNIPPLERALSVPDSHDHVTVTVDDDHGCSSCGGRGSLKTARRSDSARSERTATSNTGVEQMNPVAAGMTTTRRRAKVQHSFGSMHRAGSGTSINLSRKSYERLTGLELPPTPTPSPLPNDVPVTPDTPIVVTVATPSTLTSPRPPPPPGPTLAVRNCIRQQSRPQQPTRLPSPLPTIKMDENNVPQIDVAITPTSEFCGQTPMFTLGAPPPPRRLRSGSPSCRLRRPLSSRHGSDGVGVPATATMQVPTLTVTHDVDEDSLISDYITPSPYFSFGGKDVDRLASPFANLGDDISLYGTPKEEMSPFRELEAATTHRASTSPTNYLRDQIVAFFQPSDNKLAMKLFGNKNALMKEKLRQSAAGNWVIHPCSNFRLVTK